jgi:phenylacetic acid degradation operon negative regulatory protein
MFNARSAMLTLYGDYVRQRGGEIGIGSLIRLLGNLDLSEQSVRSAVFRMCRTGLLEVRHEKSKSYYSLTKDGLALLEEGERRIFESKTSNWDGNWSVVVYSIPEVKRNARDLLRQRLTWMGYGPLTTATWISPRDMTEGIEKLAVRLKIQEYVQTFCGKNIGFSDPKSVISHCWNLKRIHKAYADFIATHRAKLEDHLALAQKGEDIEPSQCFSGRFELIHQYRRLPYFDPNLPEELLPKNWLRSQASALFNEYYDLLTEKANSYFDSVLKDY